MHTVYPAVMMILMNYLVKKLLHLVAKAVVTPCRTSAASAEMNGENRWWHHQTPMVHLLTIPSFQFQVTRRVQESYLPRLPQRRRWLANMTPYHPTFQKNYYLMSTMSTTTTTTTLMV
jgi:hypothetical protein